MASTAKEALSKTSTLVSAAGNEMSDDTRDLSARGIRFEAVMSVLACVLLSCLRAVYLLHRHPLFASLICSANFFGYFL